MYNYLKKFTFRLYFNISIFQCVTLSTIMFDFKITYLISIFSGLFIIGAKRTPFCKHGGLLRELPASYVFAAAAKDAINSANLDPSLIDHTIIGNVNFVSFFYTQRPRPILH